MDGFGAVYYAYMMMPVVPVVAGFRNEQKTFSKVNVPPRKSQKLTDA